MSNVSAKEQIRRFLIANVGVVVTSTQIREAAGLNVSEWARRVRELRDEDGWIIDTHNDDVSLKPGEYRLREFPDPRQFRGFKRTISTRLRAQVLDRDGSTCQMCGITVGDADPATGRLARLHVGHIVDKSLGGKDEISNLRTLCSSCNQGAKNVTMEKPSTLWLFAQVRRASDEQQRLVFNWLRKKYGDTAT